MTEHNSTHYYRKYNSLDPEQTESMIEVVGTLLKDSVTMVLGAAIAAFNQLCPHKYELIHHNYRKLCHLLCDLDEWGQIEAINMLTRYCRVHFMDPGKAKEAKRKAKEQRRADREARKLANGADESDSESESDVRPNNSFVIVSDCF